MSGSSTGRSVPGGVVATAGPPPPGDHARADRPGFRPDIQGLRAVAVALVILYHAGVPLLPGGYVGVDVFFVISGFLITGVVLRQVQAEGRVDVARFYAHRIRRILPASALTVVGAAALTLTLLPVTRWATVAGDVTASSLYVVNWRLARRSVDYLAQDLEPSPLQHFWSLAVEEQFYLLWPLLLLLVAAVTRRRLGRASIGVTLAVVAAGSLAWSVWATTHSAAAYFATTTRAWELALGGLLAVGSGALGRLPRATRHVLGWSGAAALVVAATTFSASTPFPGAAALLPVLGACAVLAAGTGTTRPPLAFLGGAPFQTIGTLSYALYLWHWPLLVVADARWSPPGGHLSVPVTTATVLAGIALAWLTHRLVERPVLASDWVVQRTRNAVVTAAVCVLVGVVAAGVVDRAIGERTVDTGSPTGASGAASEPATVTPAPELAGADVPDVYGDGCHRWPDSAEPVACTYGSGSGHPLVALVGDSHAAQWQPSLRRLAEEQGWTLRTFTKSACPLVDLTLIQPDDQRPSTTCAPWGASVTDVLLAERPDLVVVSAAGQYESVVGGQRLDVDTSIDPLAASTARMWQALVDGGLRVLVVLDTPRPGYDVADCVAGHLDDPSACDFDRREGLARSGNDMLRSAADVVPQVTVVDLTAAVCPEAECVAVRDGVLTFRDDHHLTATYARSLAPELERALRDAGLPDVAGSPGR